MTAICPLAFIERGGRCAGSNVEVISFIVAAVPPV